MLLSSVATQQAVRLGGRADFFELEMPPELDRPGAPLYVKRPDSVDEYKREVTALGQLQEDPRIVRLIEHDPERYLICVEGAPGENLNKIIEFDGGLPEAKSGEVIRELAATLSFVHSDQDKPSFVHYDISASNLFWEQNEAQLTLIDFGTAFKLDEIPADYSEFPVGSPPYMSPEKLDLNPSFGRESDIYALGVVWYELLTGSLPFHQDFGDLKKQIQRDEPLPIRTCSRATNDLIMSILAKSPGVRPSLREIIDFLED